MKILIVDDNNDSRMILRKILESEGHTIEAAVNGEEALVMAQKSPPDMIISDILMPVMDGFTLCCQCKEDQRLQSIPFVFFTATFTDEKDEELALNMGAARFIRKPAEPDEFIKILRGVIEDWEKGGTSSVRKVQAEEKDTLKLYSERLVHKLEKRQLDLEREIAGKAHTEEQLRRARLDWENIFQATGQPSLLLDPGYTILEANRAAAESTNMSKEELIGRKCYEIFHKTDMPPEDCPLNKLLLTKDFEQTPMKIEALDRTFLVSCTPVLNEAGSLEKVIHIATDITQQIRTEEALQASEERYRTLYDSMMDAFVNVDMDGHIRDWNKSFLDMLGYTPEEVMTLTYQDLTLEKWHAMEQAIVEQQIIPKGYSDIYEKECRKKDGTIFPVEMRTFLLRDKGGNPSGMWAIVRDITERKKAMKAVQESEVKYRRLFEAAKDGILILNEKTGRIEDANPFLLDLLGYSYEEILNKEIWELSPFKDILANKSAFAKLKGKKYIRYEDLPLQTIEGKSAHVEFISNVYQVDDHKVIQCNIRDITERKMAAAALQESEKKYRLVVDNASEAILVAQDTFIRFFNPKALELLGYSEKEVRSMSFIDFIVPEDRDMVIERHQRRMRGEVFPAVYSLRVLDKKQNIRWIEVNAVAISWKGTPATLIFFSDITQRKHAEAALHNHMDFLDTLINTIPAPVFYKDRDGVYLGCNDQYAATLMGLPREVIIGHTIVDLEGKIPADLAQRHHDSDLDLLRAPGFRFYEEDTPCADGTTRTFVYSKTAFTDAQGQVSGMVGIMMDISRRKLAEQELEASQQNLSIHGRISESFLLCSGDEIYDEILKIIVEISQSTYGLFGYLDEERNIIVPALTSEVWEDCLIPEKTFVFSWEKICNSIFGRTVTGKASIRTNLKANVPEGHVPIENILTVPIIFQDAVIGIFAVANKASGYGEAEERRLKDVAEYIAPILQSRLQQEKEEQRRRKSEAYILKQAKVLEQSLDGIAIADLEGVIQYVNPAWAALHGYTPDELTGVNLDTFSTPGTMKTERDSHPAQLKPGIFHTETAEHRRKDGTVFSARISIFTLKDDRGTPVNIVAYVRDITEEKRLDNLLHQAQKMEAVGQLAGGIAHDFNNMLSPILGYADLILMNMKPEEPYYQELLQIRKAGERAKDLTWQLLALSRKQIMEMKNVDLNTVVTDLNKILRRTIREDIAINVSLSPKPMLIKGDTGNIGQILINLAVNAQDAMPNGGTIFIETADAVLDESYTTVHPGLLPGRYAMLSLSDTGCGMDQHTIEHIYEPFFTTKDPGKGTGLGLATIFGIVKQHNGYIMVYSEPGTGTTFKVCFPKIQDEEGADAEIVEIEEFKPGTETVLVVEDEESVRDLACRILRDYGYTVISAEDAQECLRIIEQYKGSIDLLLTDVIMPGMNGKQLFDSITAAIPSIKVIFLSGYTNDVLFKHGLLMPGTNFISKPFTVRELTGKVRAVLDG